MKKYTQEELQKILADHSLWLTDNTKGTRAYLRGADLRGADLRYANLQGANLWDVDLEKVNLRNANFEYVWIYKNDEYSKLTKEEYLFKANQELMKLWME